MDNHGSIRFNEKKYIQHYEMHPQFVIRTILPLRFGLGMSWACDNLNALRGLAAASLQREMDGDCLSSLRFNHSESNVLQHDLLCLNSKPRLLGIFYIQNVYTYYTYIYILYMVYSYRDLPSIGVVPRVTFNSCMDPQDRHE